MIIQVRGGVQSQDIFNTSFGDPALAPVTDHHQEHTPCAPQREPRSKHREACVRRRAVLVTQIFGTRLHSVPSSSRLQGRNGQRAISIWSSPRAPATAGFEQRMPRVLSRSKSSPTVQRLDSRPVRQATSAVLRSASKRLGVNEFFQGFAPGSHVL